MREKKRPITRLKTHRRLAAGVGLKKKTRKTTNPQNEVGSNPILSANARGFLEKPNSS